MPPHVTVVLVDLEQRAELRPEDPSNTAKDVVQCQESSRAMAALYGTPEQKWELLKYQLANVVTDDSTTWMVFTPKSKQVNKNTITDIREFEMHNKDLKLTKQWLTHVCHLVRRFATILPAPQQDPSGEERNVAADPVGDARVSFTKKKEVAAFIAMYGATKAFQGADNAATAVFTDDFDTRQHTLHAMLGGCPLPQGITVTDAMITALNAAPEQLQHSFEEGDIVWAKWGGLWYPGRVKKVLTRECEIDWFQYVKDSEDSDDDGQVALSNKVKMSNMKPWETGLYDEYCKQFKEEGQLQDFQRQYNEAADVAEAMFYRTHGEGNNEEGAAGEGMGMEVNEPTNQSAALSRKRAPSRKPAPSRKKAAPSDNSTHASEDFDQLYDDDDTPNNTTAPEAPSIPMQVDDANAIAKQAADAALQALPPPAAKVSEVASDGDDSALGKPGKPLPEQQSNRFEALLSNGQVEDFSPPPAWSPPGSPLVVPDLDAVLKEQQAAELTQNKVGYKHEQDSVPAIMNEVDNQVPPFINGTTVTVVAKGHLPKKMHGKQGIVTAQYLPPNGKDGGDEKSTFDEDDLRIEVTIEGPWSTSAKPQTFVKYFPVSDLKLQDEVCGSAEERPFKPGMSVRVKGKRHHCTGMVGEVTDSSGPKIEVEFAGPNGIKKHFKAHDLVLHHGVHPKPGNESAPAEPSKKPPQNNTDMKVDADANDCLTLEEHNPVKAVFIGYDNQDNALYELTIQTIQGKPVNRTAVVRAIASAQGFPDKAVDVATNKIYKCFLCEAPCWTSRCLNESNRTGVTIFKVVHHDSALSRICRQNNTVCEIEVQPSDKCWESAEQPQGPSYVFPPRTMHVIVPGEKTHKYKVLFDDWSKAPQGDTSAQFDLLQSYPKVDCENADCANCNVQILLYCSKGSLNSGRRGCGKDKESGEDQVFYVQVVGHNPCPGGCKF